MWGSISTVAVAGGGGGAAASTFVWSSTESSEANNIGAV